MASKDEQPNSAGSGVKVTLPLSSPHTSMPALKIEDLFSIFEQTTIGIVYGDRTGRFIEMNQAFCTISGYSREELKQISCGELTHPDDWAIELNYVGLLLARELNDYSLEKRYIRRDGSYTWVSVTVSPVWDEHGEFRYGIALVRDINQQKQEQQRIERERQLAEASLEEERRLFITGPTVIFKWKPTENWEVEYVSPNVYELLGYTTQAFTEQQVSYAEIVHPADLDRVAEEVKQYVLQGDDFYEQEYRVRHANGSYCWLYDFTAVLRNEAGEVSYFLGYVQNITESKRVELSLKESEERLRLALEAGHTGTWDWNILTNQIIFSNNLKELLEIDSALAIASFQNFAATIYPDDRHNVLEQFSRAIKSGEELKSEFRLLRSDDSIRWIMAQGNVIYDRFGQPVRMVGVDVDITERKLAEESLRRYERVVEATTDSVALLDRQYRYLLVNQSYLNHHQTNREQIIGRSVVDVFGEEMFQSKLKERLDQALDGQILQYQEWFNDSTHAPMFLGITYAPYYTLEGSIAGVVVTRRNLTDLKQAEIALQQQAEQERLLNVITRHIRQSLNLQEILTATVTEALHLLKCDRVLILRIYSDCTCKVEAQASNDRCNTLTENVYELECSICRYPIDCPITPSDGERHLPLGPSGCPIANSVSDGIEDQLFIPILNRENLWGFLALQQCERRNWQPEQVDVMTAIANQVGIAIQQAHLYEQVQQFNLSLEQQIQEQTEELRRSLHFEALLKQIIEKVRESLDEEKILETAVKNLAMGLQLECCDAGIYSADQNYSTIAYEYTNTLQPAKGNTFPTHGTLNSYIYERLFQGKYCHFCFLSSSCLRPEHQALSILAYPIIDDQEVLGDLWLFKQRGEAFCEQEIRLVQQVADQCAIAVRQSRLYQTSQTQVQELERLNLLKDDFLSTVSHELRTPMSNIKMATQMLQISLQTLNILTPGSRIAQYLQILDNECQRETNLINDLLDLSRLDAKTDALMPMSIDLRSWIPAILEPFEQRIHNQQQHLNIHIPDDLPALMTDLAYFERIMAELIQNACKYTPSGERIIISAEVLPADGRTTADSSTLDTRIIQLTVTNTGLEISESELDRIFDKFYRIPSNDPWKFGGTGLGLPLVKKLVEVLQGTITVTSRDRQVSFAVTLPLNPLE